jgi:hypothetical protein
MHETNTKNPIDFPQPIDFPEHPFEELLYNSGLIAQGGWDELDPYQRDCIIQLVQLVAKDCVQQLEQMPVYYKAEPHATVEINTISDCIRTILERYCVG